jgi:PKD repeat protein
MVTITVASVPDAPVANDDAYSGVVNAPLAVVAPGVLANDTDADGDLLTSVLATGPVSGSLALAADGSFVYTPTLNFTGTLTFSYQAFDGALYSNPATVTLQITGQPPEVYAGADQTSSEGQQVSFSGAYTLPLSLMAGELIQWDLGDGELVTGTLTPTHSYLDNGIYAVTLTVTDSQGLAGQDTLVVTVSNVAPLLSPIPDQQLEPGEAFTVTLAFSDPGTLDMHVVVIEWAAGVSETFTLTTGVLELPVSHMYDQAGAYTVSVTVTDQDGDEDTGSFDVEVSAVLRTWLPVVLK